MSKFKVGDRVRYIGNLLNDGMVGTIVAFRNGTPGVRFDDALDCLHNLSGVCENHHGWWTLEKNLELANESNKPKFNVGDLVLIVGPKDPDLNAVTDDCLWVPSGMKGTCGMVARVSELGIQPNRYHLNGHLDCWYVGEWLKKYPYDKMPKFQKGDRVKFISDFTIQCGCVATVMGINCFTSNGPEFLLKLDIRNEGWRATPSDIARLKEMGIHNVSRDDGMVYWYAREETLDLERPKGKKSNTVTNCVETSDKTKFQVGDKIIGNQKANKYGITRMGWTGTVVGVSGETISVESTDCFSRFMVDSDCFDLVSRKETEKTPKKTPKVPKKDPISGDAPRRVVIEITSEGAKAKYIHNGTVEKEARIHRWHGDKPDDAKAAKYAVDALFGTNKTGEDAEWASKTAEILNHMDWQDILFKAYCEKK